MTASYTKVGRLCAATVFIDARNAITAGEAQSMVLDMPIPISGIASAHAVVSNMYTYRYDVDKKFQFRPMVNFPAGYSGTCGFVYMTAS